VLRFFAALLAAIVSLVLAVVVAAVVSESVPRDAASVAAVIAFIAVPIVTFVLVYRAIPRSRRALRAEVRERQEQAIDRGIPEKAAILAHGGEGLWQEGTLRVTGGPVVTIDIVVNATWTTVFQARFHPEKEGQYVPWFLHKSGWVTTTRRGNRPARWEVLMYRSGPWEDELDAQVRAAEEATLARDRERMGLA
jgi:hypothetical protein